MRGPLYNVLRRQRVTYTYTVVIERDEDGVYIAVCPALPGCYTQGRTYREALDHIRDAIVLHLQARQDLGEPIPIETAIEKVEVALETPSGSTG